MPGKFNEENGSKYTRMWWSDDMAHLNVRREHLAHVVHYKKNIDVMKKLAREKGPLRILDVGCGEANTVRLFYAADHSRKSDVIKSYTGLEGDASCVERTEERAATVLRGINGTLHVCDITQGDFPVKRGSQDLIISNEVLEHIPRRKVPVVLRAMHRVGAADATFLISTPNKDGTNEKLPADHVYEWGYEELREAFAAAGFEVVDHMGVYIKKANLVRWLAENEPGLVEWAKEIWERFGLDMGSMYTADWARPVCNNLIWTLKKAS